MRELLFFLLVEIQAILLQNFMKNVKKLERGIQMELLSVKDAASILSVKESTFRTWINRKQIPDCVIFRIGNTVRIIKSKFENWINGGI